MPGRGRPAWAEVDLGAVASNVRLLQGRAPGAALCAVVKADGYGHGAVEVATTALEAGASWLAVALPSEGAALRAAGVGAPVLLLSEADDWSEVLALGLTPTVHSERGVLGLAEEVRRRRAGRVAVHLKVDTGMHRIGAAPEEALERARLVLAQDGLALGAVWTHCPVADEPGNEFTVRQADRFDAVLADLRADGIDPPLVHAGNSAVTLAHPRFHHDMVRCGIAVYGLAPSAAMANAAGGLRPALSLKSVVSHVQVLRTGEACSYGLRRPVERDTVVATVPIGYADGVPRRLSSVGGEVLVGGRRRPFAGTITMDQLLVDCGRDRVAVGDEVVLLGEQGDERIAAAEWASLLDTITYEITCGISPRIPRVYAGSGGMHQSTGG